MPWVAAAIYTPRWAGRHVQVGRIRILFVAPLPPPITGHSLAAKVFLDELSARHETAVVNLSLGSKSNGTVTRRRILEVVKVLVAIRKEIAGADAIYLTISESLAGNIKDLCIYALCVGRLSRTFIHLHGGSIKKILFDPHATLKRINALFIHRMGGVIISGKAHKQIFAGMIDPASIHIVPNFAQDHLFVTRQTVIAKFAETQPVRVLYLSAMTGPKGYEALLDGYLGLSSELMQNFTIDFAGRFESDAERAAFERKIEGHPGIRYHGMVDEITKQALFSNAHLFCLPTSGFEGQPLSLLEAYASGCVVATTDQEGIRDVFERDVNGFQLADASASSISTLLTTICSEKHGLLGIALENRDAAEKCYRTAIHTARLTEIVESALPSRRIN